MCKSWCEAIVAIVVIVFGFMVTSPVYAQWILVIAGVLLLVHSFTCKKCFAGHGGTIRTSMSSSRRRRR